MWKHPQLVFWRQNTHNNPIFSLKTHHSRQVLEFICTPSWKQAKHHFKVKSYHSFIEESVLLAFLRFLANKRFTYVNLKTLLFTWLKLLVQNLFVTMRLLNVLFSVSWNSILYQIWFTAKIFENSVKPWFYQVLHNL